MNRLMRVVAQRADEVWLQKTWMPRILKTDSFFERAKKLKLAVDLPFSNRAMRRRELKKAIPTERIAKGM